ncbi:MAG: transglutaminase domain-containing protein, partial [Planctomycetales bacterium]|nr:transglutaminase domain-containing protein [Planctomycetales bacterium]
TSPNTSFEVDLALDSLVSVAGEHAKLDTAERAVYRIQLDTFEPAQIFSQDDQQKIISSQDHAAILTVNRAASSPATPSDQPTEEDLGSSPLIQCDATHVVALAEAVAGGTQRDALETARLLEKYIFKSLEKSEFTQVFDSAETVAVQKKGDCSEHAVLLAAACRARKIPARIVIGLIYSPERQGFLYHMWNEVWVTDRWVALDATLGRGGIGAGHLRFRASNLASETAYGLISPVLRIMGRLQIEVDQSE